MRKGNITGVVLAGGRATRMGGIDKGLVKFRDKEMIAHVCEQLEQQCDSLVINANRNLDLYRKYGYPVISDDLEGYQGPLAGMLACMKIASPGWIVAVPCDGPFIHQQYVDLLQQGIKSNENRISVAYSHGRLQPVYAMLEVSLHRSLENYLESGERKIDRWYEMEGYTSVEFSDPTDMFLNINTNEDLETLEKKI